MKKDTNILGESRERMRRIRVLCRTYLGRKGFKNLANSNTNRPSCIHLKDGRAKSETKYDILVNSVVNQPNSEVSTEILN